MTPAPPAQQRETYRERLYRHYLTTHVLADLSNTQSRLKAAAPHLKRMLKYFPANRDARVLDLGCGFGSHLYWLKQAGYHNLEGVDGSPEQVETAHGLGLDCVSEENITDHLAGRKAETCDVVLAFDVLEHFTKDEAFQFVDEVFRILTPGGKFILHLPNNEGFLSGTIAHGDFTHELFLNRVSLAQLLRCAGFSQIRAYEDTPMVHGLTSMVRYLVWAGAKTALRIVYAAQTGSTDREMILTPTFLAVARK